MIIMGMILIVNPLYDWYEEQQADVENADIVSCIRCSTQFNMQDISNTLAKRSQQPGDLENEFPNDAKRSKQQEDPAISLVE